LVGVPVYVERLSGSKYMVQASAQDASTYDVVTNTLKEKVPVVDIQEVLNIDKPFESKNLGFSISFNSDFKLEEGAKMYFTINNLTSVSERYQNALTIEPISLESNIVQLTIKDGVPQK